MSKEAGTNTVYLPSGGSGIGVGGAALGIGVLAIGVYYGNRYLNQRNKNESEQDLDTPAGSVALQLKTVFESFPVSDNDYRRVALLMTPEIKDDVYKLYKKNTGRNLSDDIANHIGAGTQTVAAKQEAINSTPGTLITIGSNDQIKFNVNKGSIVRFEPGSKLPIPLFEKPEGVLPEGILRSAVKPFYTLQPTAVQFLVNDIKTIDLNGLKLAEGWGAIFKPIVRTRKVFVAVQIAIPLQANSQGVKRIVYLWADARLFRTGKGTNYLKGISNSLGDTASKLI